MSADLALLDVNALVPDGIEPVEGYRCWDFQDGRLLSLNGGGKATVWTPGQPLTASCHNEGNGTQYRWNVVRRGITREVALAKHAQINSLRSASYSMSFYSSRPQPSPAYCPTPPAVDLPDGYGLELETVTHAAPHENCTCGIYAAGSEKGVPAGGNVYGKVKLWGKVIPGEKGLRAQYAYPSEFRVAADLAEHPRLKAFGVPIVVDESIPSRGPSLGGLSFQFTGTSGTVFSQPYPATRSGASLWLMVAVAVNLGFAALNLALVIARFA